MKTGIHPTWYPNAKITCACGHTFEAGSTREEIRVEICSACHPFFTGQQKYVDPLGRVERFQQKTQAAKARTLVKKSDKKKNRQEEEENKPKTLREMAQRIRAELKSKG